LVIREQHALDRTLRSVQEFVICYPHVAASIVRALVEEGKTFARTPEGACLRRALGSAEWIEKGRILWEACGLDELLEDSFQAGAAGDSLLSPSRVRALFEDLAHADIEQLLSKMMFQNVPQGHENSAPSGS
jgi:hypothetical protein